MKAKPTLYWVTTTLIALETLAGGVMDLRHGRTMVVSGEPVAAVVTRLGYPVYVLHILGPWKLAGGIVVLVPGHGRLKEWAYAGLVFELTGAVASQAARGRARETLAPLALLGLALTSWALRPRSRTLGAAGR